MSRATLYVQFPDGSVRYGIYDGTSDVAWPALFDHPSHGWDAYQAHESFERSTYSEPVPVRLATDYGGGCSWDGEATSEAVTAGFDEFEADGYEDGLPSWAKWPGGQGAGVSGETGQSEFVKNTVALPVSVEMLETLAVTGRAMRIAMGIEPDPRTPAQIAADKAEREAQLAWERAQAEAHHAANMATATGLRRAVLELHAPVWPEWSHFARCEGCDLEGYEVEPPEFPCRTYTLAAGFARGDTGPE